MGSELRLCRPFATLFYLSTLPPASPSLPSAVGHLSVAVGSVNITDVRKIVNLFLKKFSDYLKFQKKSSRRNISPSAYLVALVFGIVGAK